MRAVKMVSTGWEIPSGKVLFTELDRKFAVDHVTVEKKTGIHTRYRPRLSALAAG